MTSSNKNMLIYGLATVGFAAGIILAVHRKSGFWGGVGWSLVGNMAGAGIGYVAAAMIPSK